MLDHPGGDQGPTVQPILCEHLQFKAKNKPKPGSQNRNIQLEKLYG